MSSILTSYFIYKNVEYMHAVLVWYNTDKLRTNELNA